MRMRNHASAFFLLRTYLYLIALLNADCCVIFLLLFIFFFFKEA